MLNKEEIETCKEELNNHIEFMESAGDNAGWARGLKWYIEQLESDKQKLIEKLEEDINVDKIQWHDELGRIIKEEPKSRLVSRKRYAQEILEIVKGENDE